MTACEMGKNRQSKIVNRKSPPPRLVLIAEGFTQSAKAERIEAAVEAGVAWVHLRDHAAPADVFEQAAEALARRLRAIRPDVRVSVNGRLAVARRLGLGLHTGRRGPDVRAARQALGADALIGFSAHGLDEGRQALAAGADYLFYSPIFLTMSKPGQCGVGVGALAACCSALAPAPVFALGGITPARVGACLEAGAHGVAVLSGILAADDPAQAAQAYREALVLTQPDDVWNRPAMTREG